MGQEGIAGLEEPSGQAESREAMNRTPRPPLPEQLFHLLHADQLLGTPAALGDALSQGRIEFRDRLIISPLGDPSQNDAVGQTDPVSAPKNTEVGHILVTK